MEPKKPAVSTPVKPPIAVAPVTPLGVVAWPTYPRKPLPDVVFLDKAYVAGIKGNGGKWLMAPGQWHTGIDLNGPKGGNTDLGQPIYAAAAGVVTFAGQGDGTSWGNLVTIWHGTVGTRYGHLQRVMVTKGQSVRAGQQIGTMGRGYNNRWYAHLHFDVFKKTLPTASYWPGSNLAKTKEYFVDPWAWLKANRAVDLGEA